MLSVPNENMAYSLVLNKSQSVYFKTRFRICNYYHDICLMCVKLIFANKAL